MPRLFALDHNFPQPIAEVLGEFQVDAELVRIVDLHPGLAELDDWELLLALRHHPRPWDGLITTDSSILNQPLELSVLIQTKLTLVVALEAGHNPVKATGLLFAYLSSVCQRTDPSRPQVWKLSAANRPHIEPWDELARVAAHQHRDTTELFEEHRLSAEELDHDPLAE